jgi:hypothetical protein
MGHAGQRAASNRLRGCSSCFWLFCSFGTPSNAFNGSLKHKSPLTVLDVTDFRKIQADKPPCSRSHEKTYKAVFLVEWTGGSAGGVGRTDLRRTTLKGLSKADPTYNLTTMLRIHFVN